MKILTHARTILFAAASFTLAGTLCAADLDGKWKAEFETQIGQLKYTYELKTDAGKITGKAIRQQGDDTNVTTTEITEGKLDGTHVSFVEPLKIQDQDLRVEYTGSIDGDQLKLTRKVGDFGTTDIVAKRVKTAAVSVAGKWSSEFDTQVGRQKYVYEFKVDGEALTGKAIRDMNDEKTTTDIKGTVKGEDITFTESLKIQDQDINVEYTGKIAGDEIKFTRKVGDFATEELVAKRTKDADAK